MSVAVTHFEGRKFGYVSSGTKISNGTSPVKLGEVRVPRTMAFRRLYFAYLVQNWAAAKTSIRLNFITDNQIARTIEAVWDGASKYESTWWYGTGTLGQVASNNPFFPAFEVHQRAPGTSNLWPYDVHPSPDSMVAAVDIEDIGLAKVTPYQVVMHPFRMVGEFDWISVEAMVESPANNVGTAGILQVWLGCASDEKRA